MCFYGEPIDATLADKIVRARKRWWCGECSRPIAPGDFYRRFTGIFEGEFFEARWCARCEFVRHVIHYVEREIEGCDEYESWPLIGGTLSEDWRHGDYAERLGVPWKHLDEVPRW